jgi:DNA-binding transcriptional ArsR family regulator
MKNHLEIKNLKKAVLLLKSMNHPLRVSILKMIHTKKDITVTEIYRKLKIEQSVVSQHLALLRNNKIVTTNKDGRFVRYKINYDRIDEITKVVEKLIKD